MVKSRLVKRSSSTLAGIALAAAMIVFAAPQAHADPVDLACVGTRTVTWSPGLTLVERDVTTNISTIYGSCTSPVAPEITSGTSFGSFQETSSCLTGLQPAAGQTTIHWNTGETSTFSFNVTITRVGGNAVITSTGAITAGKFTGSTAEQVVTNATLDTLDCLQPGGVTSATGALTFTVRS